MFFNSYLCTLGVLVCLGGWVWGPCSTLLALWLGGTYVLKGQQILSKLNHLRSFALKTPITSANLRPILGASLRSIS